jgi:hypothetical protein
MNNESKYTHRQGQDLGDTGRYVCTDALKDLFQLIRDDVAFELKRRYPSVVDYSCPTRWFAQLSALL